MLTFKTQFPMRPEKDIPDLIEAERIWLAGSPHSKLATRMRAIKAEEICDEWGLMLDSESVVFAEHQNGARLCALRYENTDQDAMRWVTEIIGEKTDREFWVAIQLNVDSDLPVERLDYGKRPYIVKTIMQKIGGGMDGSMPVSDRPLLLADEQLDLAIDLITANAGCTMPVVYVSADVNNKPYIDAARLAQWLSGMAHVVVEPTRGFSFELMRHVYGENAYGGAAAIYWPDGVGRWLFLPRGEYADPQRMQAEIAKKVRLSLLSQRTKRSLSWAHIQELKAKKRIRELKESGSAVIDDYVAAFDGEIRSKNEEIHRLEQEINRLKYGALGSAPRTERGRGEITLDGQERDLYQGERLFAVLEALHSAAAASEPQSRRRAILDDLLEANIQEGERDSILEVLKELLRSYSAMNSVVRRQLEHLGFDISEDGKHYKLVFRGDNRFPFILPKSGSDYRGGLNAFSDLKKRLF